MSTTATAMPRVWVGCLACHNNGRLVGDWFDAEDAEDVTTYDIHGANTRADLHDELWCFDLENMPVGHEMSPHEAAEWARAITSVPEHQRDALCAWVRGGDYVADGTGDLPSIPDFEERYCGEWTSFREYAENLADETGLFSDVAESIATYFDWESWTRDLAFDYTVEDAPSCSVFVFRSL